MGEGSTGCSLWKDICSNHDKLYDRWKKFCERNVILLPLTAGARRMLKTQSPWGCMASWDLYLFLVLCTFCLFVPFTSVFLCKYQLVCNCFRHEICDYWQQIGSAGWNHPFSACNQIACFISAVITCLHPGSHAPACNWPNSNPLVFSSNFCQGNYCRSPFNQMHYRQPKG